jgi:hypothetical protein
MNLISSYWKRGKIHHARKHNLPLTCFTQVPSESRRADTRVGVNSIRTRSAVLTSNIRAVVDVLWTVEASKTRNACAGIGVVVVDARGAIFTRDEVARCQFCGAGGVSIARSADAGIGVDTIKACSAILTWARLTLIYVWKQIRKKIIMTPTMS